ncbi:MAG: efflux RND transporter periplasmic adaptor subunit [Ignavibacteriae bacterium]|nr:MAG: efflux RND transporter periplasmic adaptor subunit [Ignavibacteriota bacterium]
MKNKNLTKILIAVLVIIIVVAGGLFAYNQIFKGKSTVTKAEVYTCPMHPQIISDHFGSCPICGMDLVLKSQVSETSGENDEHDVTGMDLQEVKLSPSQQVLANVQTEVVGTKQFSGEKTFNGYVKMNEKNTSRISSAVMGKIVRLNVNFEGQHVGRGQQVMEVYSPDLISAQKEYLLALKNLNQISVSGNTIATEQAQSLLNSAREKLGRWELTQGQINELENTQQVMNSIPVYSKYSGIVTKKYANVGQWVMEGEVIADLADLSTVWVIANIYESEVQYIKAGQIAQITSSSYPDEIFTSKINFIDPVFNPDTRTMEVRIDVANRSNKLKPDMFVKIKLNTFASQTIAVPKNAVIRTGEHDIIYIEKEKGVYTPREVKVVYEQDGYYSVTGDIKEGEKVVSSGGFLIDSETQIQKGFTSGHEQHKDKSKDEELKINPDQDIMKDMKNKK